jgi:hypothetical protein
VIFPKLRVNLRFATVPVLQLLLVLVLIAILTLPLCSSPAGSPPASNDKDKEKPYALIFGTVWGPDDHPIYGVTVKIRRANDKPKKVRWELYSDHHGEFAQRVPAGEADYIVWADLKHFKSPDGKPLRLVKEVTVHIYNEERQDMGLHLAYQQP